MALGKSMLHLATRVCHVFLSLALKERIGQGESAKSGTDLLWVLRVFFHDQRTEEKHVGISSNRGHFCASLLHCNLSP